MRDELEDENDFIGVLIGYAAGGMLGRGVSKAGIREILEVVFEQLPELTATGGSS